MDHEGRQNTVNWVCRSPYPVSRTIHAQNLPSAVRARDDHLVPRSAGMTSSVVRTAQYLWYIKSGERDYYFCMASVLRLAAELCER